MHDLRTGKTLLLPTSLNASKNSKLNLRGCGTHLNLSPSVYLLFIRLVPYALYSKYILSIIHVFKGPIITKLVKMMIDNLVRKWVLKWNTKKRGGYYALF